MDPFLSLISYFVVCGLLKDIIDSLEWGLYLLPLTIV